MQYYVLNHLLVMSQFAVLLGDDVVVNDKKPALRQLIDAYIQKEASVVGVQTVEHKDVINMESLDHQNHILLNVQVDWLN